MAIEKKIRSIAHKSVTYPWLRRYVVVGPYNRKARQDAAASVLVMMFDAAARTAAARKRRARGKQTDG